MTKIALVLSVVAVALAAVGLFRGTGAGSSGAGSSSGGSDRLAAPSAEGTPSDAMIREARTAAHKESQEVLAATLQKEIDPRVLKLEALRKRLEESIAEMLRLAESTADGSTTRVEEVERSVRKDTSDFHNQIAALQKAVAELKARPVAKETPKEAAPETPKPATPVAPPGPAEPPPAPRMPNKEVVVDHALVKKEVDEALKGLEAKETAVLSKSIETLRKHKTASAVAVPRLGVLLLDSKGDTFVRMSAASALGDIGSADAVEPLIEAIVDSEYMVAQQAGKSILKLTGYDAKMTDSPGIRERRKKKTEIKEWWKKHEAEVRERLSGSSAGETPVDEPPK